MFSNGPGFRRMVELDDEFVPILREEETLLKKFSDIAFSFSAKEDSSTGVLYVTSQRILFINPQRSLDFDVSFIMLHAVSKDPVFFPKSCIYCQFNMDEPDEEEEGEEEPTECFFAPSDEEELMPMFETFSQAAALNPDPEDEEMEDDYTCKYSTDDLIFNEEEVMHGANAAKLAEWESKFIEPAGEQFEDAEEPSQTTKYYRTES